MTFWQAFKASYRGSIVFILACPLMALFPVIFELLQHLAEAHIGMYDSVATGKAVANDPMRLSFGLVKVTAMLLPGYWVVRFLGYGDSAKALRIEAPAITLFLVYLGFEVALSAVLLFGVPPLAWAQFSSIGAEMILDTLLMAWGVAAALGNGVIGPRMSVIIMGRQFVWTFVFSIAVTLPLMLPHYFLAAVATLVPKVWLWPVLITDAVLVGVLTCVTLASGYFAVVRATDKFGIELAPQG